MVDEIKSGGLGQIDGFQWDKAKCSANLDKHGIDFEDAKHIFYGRTVISESNRGREPRWVAVGELDANLVAVVFTIRDREIRIISARRARKHEERAYRNQEMG